MLLQSFLRVTTCFPKYELVIGLSLIDAGRAWGNAGAAAGSPWGVEGSPGRRAESLWHGDWTQPAKARLCAALLCGDAELQRKGGAASLRAHLLSPDWCALGAFVNCSFHPSGVHRDVKGPLGHPCGPVFSAWLEFAHPLAQGSTYKPWS